MELSTKNFSITNKTKRQLSTKLPFAALKDSVLGKSYSLSLTFVGSATSRKLNNKYRNKDKPTNILSFSLEKNEGEIIMDLRTISKEETKFDRPFENLLLFLFIHGLFHLKGFDHGVTMEKKEEVVRKKFHV